MALNRRQAYCLAAYKRQIAVGGLANCRTAILEPRLPACSRGTKQRTRPPSARRRPSASSHGRTLSGDGQMNGRAPTTAPLADKAQLNMIAKIYKVANSLM